MDQYMFARAMGELADELASGSRRRPDPDPPSDLPKGLIQVELPGHFVERPVTLPLCHSWTVTVACTLDFFASDPRLFSSTGLCKR
jgi:hypothetical protein